MRLGVIGAALLCIGLAGACRNDEASLDESNAATTTTGPAAVVTCQSVREDLERILGAMGIPESVDQVKELTADRVDQLEALVRDVKHLAGGRAGPLQNSLSKASSDTQGAVEAIAAGNFGIAKEHLQNANDHLRRTSEQLNQVCGSSESSDPRAFPVSGFRVVTGPYHNSESPGGA